MELPKSDEARNYRIGLYLDVTIVGIPKCLWCELPVTSPSMDGPLVCPLCDMGRNLDGTKWTSSQYDQKRRNFLRRIAEYKGLANPEEEADKAMTKQKEFLKDLLTHGITVTNTEDIKWTKKNSSE
jgi:hypothetical protein